MEHPVEITRFAARARQFVDWCQTDRDGTDPKAFKLEALRRLASIYSAGLYLPHVEFKPAPDAPATTDIQRQVVAQNLMALPFQYYWEVLDPSALDGEKEPGCGDLFDDFQDIYADLSSALWLFDRGHVEAAAYSWRQMFMAHWGSHVVSAMRALHSFEFDA